MKLAVVGGGSTYTPELVDGIATGESTESMPDITEIALVDPDEARLAAVGGCCARMLASAGHPARVTTTTDLSTGVDGASAVLLQLRVGGQRARLADETVPLRCGCVGQETTGAGGFAKALRTVPVVLDIAARVRAVAGDAWLVTFTNPVGIVTRALLREGHRAVGLCNVAIGLRRLCAELLGVDLGRVRLDHAGLNHLTWLRRVLVTGDRGEVDRLPELLAEHGPRLAEHAAAPLDWLRRTGVVPSYYLKYFYDHDAEVRRQRAGVPRAQVVAEVEAELLARYADPTVVTKPALLDRRGGAHYSTAALHLVQALTGRRPGEHVVNVGNDGALPFLPADAVVEVPAAVDGTGARPLPVPPLEPRWAGLVAHVAAYERLALEAAVHGGRDRVADALLAHPLVGQYALAEELADALVAANREHLPWAG
ncbi:6-phospho-beta-glucosidase [Amycolatopsis arida]|uniref:6-phospho-beta-glucosidase n=1 Tax=Amycolatopsis arida TaxID=587909 RepID=A0A1I5ZQS3_9PSEU|nr:6-phospho-beta-glucosidase [Amycolatopsis arida]TDX89285.1 6-phospho-beta-glucosidase [Amycolatopsis arida]SFQ58703.1 6-phospho-beta-glucosidase [Amycolatopsis arida]